MSNIIVYRPGLIGNRTAFECQSSIYKYLQKKHGYRFTIVKSHSDEYVDSEFDIVSISQAEYRCLPLTPYPLLPYAVKRNLNRIFMGADGILTIDPTIYPQSLQAIKFANRNDRPVWFDTSLTHTDRGSSLYWKLVWRNRLRSAVSACSGIIMTTPRCIERFADLGLLGAIASDKFITMGHPVDTVLFSRRDVCRGNSGQGKLKIIVISRLIPEKGHIYIIEALAPLLRKNENISMDFIGAGVLHDYLIREIKEKGLERSIKIIAAMPHSELPKHLNEADLFINHAISVGQWEEYFGAANLEAMACELPTIVTSSGGISYVIRGSEVALFVGERSIADIREAVTRLIVDEGLRERLSKNARKYVLENYDLSVIAEKYHQMLQKGLSRQ